MSGIIRIDLPKGTEAGQTSLSPVSPKISATTSPAPNSQRNTVLLGYGVMAAKQSLSIGIQELKDGGNEELATGIENAITGAAIATTAFYTGGASLVVTGIQGAGQIVQRELRNNRVNKTRALERSMKGTRLNYNSGGGYE